MRGLRTQNRKTLALINRITWIVIRLLFIIVIFYFIWAQNNYVVTRHYVFSSQDLKKSFVGYRVLHISDICNTSNDVLSKANKANPDIIILTGGYADVNGNYSNTVKIVNKLCNIAPVYYIYNTTDSQDYLGGTSAINLTDRYIDIAAPVTDVNAFIEKAYGSKILNKANKGDEEALQYVQYVKDELSETAYETIRLCGINNMENWNFNDIQKLSYNITGTDEDSVVLMMNGNLANLDSLCKTNIDMLFVGGTFGKSSSVASCSKGNYSYMATELFVSGGCGNYTESRKFNFPEIQLIVLSDGTIKQYNPLENALDKIIGDVGTIYDNDGGFHEYTYDYTNK